MKRFLFACVLASPFAATLCPAAGLPDALLEEAAAMDAPRWKFVDPRRHREMRETFALQVVAVGAHLSPEVVVHGKSLASHLANKLRHFLVTPVADADGSTREPEAQGGIGGWTHNTVAQAILLARRTPEVWSKLSADERHRADVLMQALAVAAHFCLDDDNNHYLLLDGVARPAHEPRLRMRRRHDRPLDRLDVEGFG